MKQALQTLFGVAMIGGFVAFFFAFAVCLLKLSTLNGNDHETALFIGITVGVALAIYFIPSFVAYQREHPDRRAVFVINLLLGWSLVGWVVAMVWAVKSIRLDYQYR